MRKHIQPVLAILFLFGSFILATSSTNTLAQTGMQNSFVLQSEENQTTSKYGGALRIGWYYPTRPRANLNPLLEAGGLHPWVYPVFNSLVRIDEDGSLIPDLAKSWTREGLNYTFFLYDNVTWHDGQKLNAEDVKFSFEAILNDTVGTIASYWKSIIYPLDSVEIVNSTTLLFRLTEPSASFLHFGGSVPIIPKHVYEEDLYNNTAIGTGSFEFVGWNPGANMTLKANENYFRGRPYLNNVTYRWDLEFQDLVDSLMNNVIDWIPENTDPYRIEELQQIPGLSFTATDELAYSFLGCNLRNPVLNNTDFRKALALAINKTEIIEVSYLGYAESATGPLTPSLGSWYNPYVAQYNHNVSMAQEFLEKSGYSREPVTMKVADDDPIRISAASIVMEQLEAIGINVTLIIKPKDQIRTDIFVNFDFDLTLSGWTLSADPDILPLYHSDSNYNPWGYSNAELDALLEQARMEYNDTQRKIHYDLVQEILAEEIPTIFLFHRERTSAYNNDFHNAIGTPIAGGNAYTLERMYYEETLSGQGRSPVKVSFVDSEGRRTGFLNGSVVEQIPNSTFDEEFNVVKIRSPVGNYTVEVTGTGNGTYSLEIVNIALGYKFTEIPLNTIRLSQTKVYFVHVLSDGKIKVWNPLLDIYLDWKIDIRDIAAVARAFGTFPGYPKWNKAADIYEDDKIDIRDVAMVAKQFGKTWSQ